MSAAEEEEAMSFHELAARIHKMAADHGFWPEEGRNFGEMIALIHSEATEALECHRDGLPNIYFTAKFDGVDTPVYEGESGKIFFVGTNQYVGDNRRLKPEGAVVELADVIIRCLDTMHHLIETDPELEGWSVDDVILEKVEYNEGRPHKHGKAY